MQCRTFPERCSTMPNIVPERRRSWEPAERPAALPARGWKESCDGILLCRAARVCRSGRHGTARLHRSGLGARDPVARGRHEGAVLRRRSRLHLDRVRPDRDGDDLHRRQGLRLPHQPRGHVRARRYQEVPVARGAALLGEPGRRRNRRRARDLGQLRRPGLGSRLRSARPSCSSPSSGSSTRARRRASPGS